MIRYRITPTVSFPHPEGEAAMTMLARAGCIALASLCLLAGDAAAQPAKPGCTSAQTAQGTQTLRCETAITIVSENGAKFELGIATATAMSIPSNSAARRCCSRCQRSRAAVRFKVVTPQAIAAVRGTKWAVDAPKAQDIRVCRRRPCRRTPRRRAAAAASISGPAKASMSRRQAH